MTLGGGRGVGAPELSALLNTMQLFSVCPTGWGTLLFRLSTVAHDAENSDVSKLSLAVYKTAENDSSPTLNLLVMHLIRK